MRNLFIPGLFSLTAALAAGPLAGPLAAEEGEWIQLFNGTSLDGWTPKIRGFDAGENFADTFRVEDGLLTVSYDGYETFDNRFGHLFYKGTFSHYRLRVEYRFVGEQCPGGPPWAVRNNGLMIHGQTPESMEKDQSFPVSIEVQLLGGTGSGERPTASVCTPGTHIVMDGELIRRHCTPSTARTYHGDQWVSVEAEVRGNEVVRHLVEGETVLSYTQPQLDEQDEHARKLIGEGGVMLHEGTISIQAESHPTQFRKIELLPIRE